MNQFPTSLGSSPLNTLHSSPFKPPQQPPIPHHHQPFFPFHMPTIQPFPGNTRNGTSTTTTVTTTTPLLPPNPMMGIYPSSFMMTTPPNQGPMMLGHYPSPMHHHHHHHHSHSFTSPIMTLPQGIPLTSGSGTLQDNGNNVLTTTNTTTASMTATTTSPPLVTSSHHTSSPQATVSTAATSKKTKSSTTRKKKKSSSEKTTSPKKSSPPKRKIPYTSQSIHAHIISYLFEIGLSDSAKTLQNDLNNPQLLNVTSTSMKSFVSNLTNELEKLSLSSPPPKKNVTNSTPISTVTKDASSETTCSQPLVAASTAGTTTATATNVPQPPLSTPFAQPSLKISSQSITTNHTNEFNDITLKLNDNSSNNNSISSTQQNYEASQFLTILQQSITKQPQQGHTHDGIATYVDERLNNLEQALSIKENKGEIFSRLRQVEERVLKIEEHQNIMNGSSSKEDSQIHNSVHENTSSSRLDTILSMNQEEESLQEFMNENDIDFFLDIDNDPPNWLSNVPFEEGDLFE